MAEMIIQRGQIYYVDFEKATGASLKKVRPALIVQNDAGNRHSPYTIIIGIMHDSHKHLPIRVRVPKGIAGLAKDSEADCGHIETIKKENLLRFCGTLPNHYLAQIDRALAISLGLHLRNS